MTYEEKHSTYTEMMQIIPSLEKSVRTAIESRGYKVYGAFLSVGDEEHREFFCDFEYGNGTPDGYHRMYGNRTEDEIKMFCLGKKKLYTHISECGFATPTNDLKEAKEDALEFGGKVIDNFTGETVYFISEVEEV